MMNDREILLMAYGAIRAAQTPSSLVCREVDFGPIIELIEEHLWPEKVPTQNPAGTDGENAVENQPPK